MGDVVMDTCQDAMTKTPSDPDEKVKKEKREEYAAGKLKAYMNMLAGIISAKGGPFVLGSKLSTADLVMKYFIVDMIQSGDFDYVPAEYLNAWPELAAHGAAVEGSD